MICTSVAPDSLREGIHYTVSWTLITVSTHSNVKALNIGFGKQRRVRFLSRVEITSFLL